ncbi:UDP-Glycosyltransferase/glycogen phosphorylase [Cristinia sonorae]|uniref:UDP-Glycosyltransferase/glycogen phosphorylase n=1 Tax=Cristinia sonorae TaxID=1940300 RepID=A0A8K0USW0_9AGAR|nr:UDP-Glycosyltransferase/glycogen phosphorylase [Cristinia sonorae]
MSTTPQIPHLVLAGPEAWGHARPLIFLAVRTVLTRDIDITLFTTPRNHKRIVAELARGFDQSHADRQKLIRIVALDTTVEGVTGGFVETVKAEMQRYVGAFAEAYEQLLAGKPVTCHVSKHEFPAVAIPKVVVADVFLGQLIPLIKKASPQVKFIGFCSGMTAFQYISFAPTSRGGRGDDKFKVLNVAKETGRPLFEVADEIFHEYTDEIMQIPGFPKMYHWELDAQEIAFISKGFLGGLKLSLFDTFGACDGIILASPEPYEPEAVAATRAWFAEDNRETWALGPLLPSMATKEAIAGEEALSESFGQIKKFLDDAQTNYGDRSVLYISFGSSFWPAKLEKLEAFVEVLVEKKIPFIFSHASPLAKVTDSLKATAEQSGLGLLTRWAPQQTLLSHPALGWFVTHAGENSVLEAISAEVPMICWPFISDQPLNAVNLTEIHDVAYELLEVRTGNGLKPIYRKGKGPINTVDALKAEARDVLEKAFSEDGERKRRNLKALKAKLDGAWEKGGVAHGDLERLLSIV